MAGGKQSEVAIIFEGVGKSLLKNYLPFAFFVALVVALAWPLPGQKVLEPAVADVHIVTFICICLVFFVSGLTLRTDELKESLTRRTIQGTIFGFLSIVGLTPILAYAVRDLPFSPKEFSTGLAIFCIMPTTLGVGVSLVTSAKGNVALAIFLTVGTNILGVVLIPLWLRAVLSGAQTGVQKLNISYLDLFLKLLLSFSIPTAIGKILREYVPGVLGFVRAHKTHLSLFSNTILAMLIWQTISSGRNILVNAKFGNVLVVIVATTLIHFIYLIFNAICIYGLRIPPPEAVSVLIMASQKSAPVAVSVITFITTDTATQGVLAVPCVIGQLMQIFVGQPVALYLGGRIKRWNAEQAALAGGLEGKGELKEIQVEQAQVVENEVK